MRSWLFAALWSTLWVLDGVIVTALSLPIWLVLMTGAVLSFSMNYHLLELIRKGLIP